MNSLASLPALARAPSWCSSSRSTAASPPPPPPPPPLPRPPRPYLRARSRRRRQIRLPLRRAQRASRGRLSSPRTAAAAARARCWWEATCCYGSSAGATRNPHILGATFDALAQEDLDASRRGMWCALLGALAQERLYALADGVRQVDLSLCLLSLPESDGRCVLAALLPLLRCKPTLRASCSCCCASCSSAPRCAPAASPRAAPVHRPAPTLVTAPVTAP